MERSTLPPTNVEVANRPFPRGKPSFYRGPCAKPCLLVGGYQPHVFGGWKSKDIPCPKKCKMKENHVVRAFDGETPAVRSCHLNKEIAQG